MQQNSKNDSFNIEEALQTLPKKDHERLWSGLRDMTRRLLLTNPVDSRENDDSEDEGPSVTPVIISIKFENNVKKSARNQWETTVLISGSNNTFTEVWIT